MLLIVRLSETEDSILKSGPDVSVDTTDGPNSFGLVG